ncbi:MAG TPA: SemiSWEET transporter [Telluria sp.]|jgi:MtN3 and saliva related transmembrane protein
MSLDVNHLGFAAAFCTTGAFVPQVMMVWRQRGAPGISSGMYSIFILGVALWMFYGLAMQSWPVVIANAVTLVLASCVLGMKWYFGRRARA